ncbi:lanthionine synthetase LanC family protein [Dermatophilaceae bacterium Soc4.6]
MQSPDASRYDDLADAAWRWVLDQVRWDDGPWVPVPGTTDPTLEPDPAPADRDGSHSGIGGLAHTLAEIRLDRSWTDEEQRLADGIRQRLRRTAQTETDPSYFDGLSSHVGALLALDDPGGADLALARLAELAGPDGWTAPTDESGSWVPGSPCNDVTTGNGSAVLAGVWAARHGSRVGGEVGALAADLVRREGRETPGGLELPYRSERFRVGGGADDAPAREMPNWSHGTAGMAAALAVAGSTLARPDLVDAARRAAEHVVSLADTSDGGFVVETTVPHDPTRDRSRYAYGWCHGPAGTSRLFTALAHAGVGEVAGAPPLHWHDAAMHSLLRSGLPDRLWPGFWDNDGRCCGSAGVGDVVLDGFQRTGRDDWLAFALRIADAVVDRALVDGDRACWRFLEHRRDDPLLPAEAGWMQGAAGIATLLRRTARVLRTGRGAPALARMDTWWGLPGA